MFVRLVEVLTNEAYSLHTHEIFQFFLPVLPVYNLIFLLVFHNQQLPQLHLNLHAVHSPAMQFPSFADHQNPLELLESFSILLLYLHEDVFPQQLIHILLLLFLQE